ncbi:general transcription factor II-I repeat domain-containing protein 2-like [Octopus sinensis]|uniref:General transcription factor II-I repeat domain-containing protein 2-like n=1 Tax=Octopus sinensis TaxID=2607531 RepID=A0A6P7TYD7_9MOLL|nr:general transcription factor II-I repeat domain-containing protein 2-like [Octopus sinensis]
MPSKKYRTLSQENREFQIEWEEKFFFVELNGKAVCLICNCVINSLKNYTIERHYKKHSEIYNLYLGESMKKKLNILKTSFKNQSSIFKPVENKHQLLTSYKISHLLAVNMKPYSDGEIIKTAISIFCDECCPSNIQNIAKRLPLSNDTITRRIECIFEDLARQLIKFFTIKNNFYRTSKDFLYHSFAVDTSKDISDTEQMVVCIRGVTSDFKISEEFFSLRSLKGTTKGMDVLNEFLESIKEFDIDPSKIISICTDGGANMIGRNKGFHGLYSEWRLEKNLDPIFWQHCIIHQENIIAKSLKMQNVISTVLSIVNWIRGKSLNHRRFKKMLVEIDTVHNDVLYHTTVRWLSRAACLKRYICLNRS